MKGEEQTGFRGFESPDGPVTAGSPRECEQDLSNSSPLLGASAGVGQGCVCSPFFPRCDGELEGGWQGAPVSPGVAGSS